jgi:hypothetical protein
MKTTYSINADRYFAPGDRIIWCGKDMGTVVKRVDRDTLIIAWDNAQLGTTHAPSWSGQLEMFESAGAFSENSRLLLSIFPEDPTIPESFDNDCDVFADATAPGYRACGL